MPPELCQQSRLNRNVYNDIFKGKVSPSFLFSCNKPLSLHTFVVGDFILTLSAIEINYNVYHVFKKGINSKVQKFYRKRKILKGNKL